MSKDHSINLPEPETLVAGVTQQQSVISSDHHDEHTSFVEFNESRVHKIDYDADLAGPRDIQSYNSHML